MSLEGFATTLPTNADVGDCLYAFGPFVADPTRGVLHRHGAPVELTPRAFQLLIRLISARGEVIDKETLLRDVWPHAVVEENTLAKHISTLRKALRLTPADPTYIATVSGRGYRFAEPLVVLPREVEHPALAIEQDVSSPPVERQPSTPVTSVWPFGAASWRPIFAASLVVALLAGAGYVLVAARATNGVAPQAAPWQLTTGDGLQQQPAWSPDGRWIAYTDHANGRADLWRQPVGQGAAIRITDDVARESQPSWSPDGGQIAFQSSHDGGGLFIVPAFGGQPRRVTTFGCCPRWSPDGTQLLFFNEFPASPQEIQAPYVVPVTGGVPQQVAKNALDGFERPAFAWHPDGRRVSIWAREENRHPVRWRFRTVPLEHGRAVESVPEPDVEQRLRDSHVHFTAFAWAASGDALFFSGKARGVTDLWRIGVDPSTLRWVSGPDRLTVGASTDNDVALALDGSRLAFTKHRQQTRIWQLPLDSTTGGLRGDPVPITPIGIAPTHVDVSANGTRLSYRTSHAGFEELWSHHLPDGVRTPVASAGTGEVVRAPRWSRDGTRLAFYRGGSKIVIRDDVQGTDWPLTGDGERVLVPSDWSRDGTALLATCELGKNRELGICRLALDAAPAADQQMRIITSRAERSLWQAHYSPDDRWIVFSAFRDKDIRTSNLYVMPAAGGDWIPITDGDAYDDKPRWSADGRTIYYVSNRSGFVNVWGRRIDTSTGRPAGAPFRVTTFDSPDRTLLPVFDGLDLSVARNSLFLSISDISGQVWVLDNIARRP